MSPVLSFSLWVAVLVLGMVLAMELGRHLRGVVSARRHEGDEDSERSGAVEGAVFALFGLLVAFTFTGAASRFDARRNLITDETNAVGTAWLRLDLLSPESQPRIKDLVRQYVDERLATEAALPDMDMVRQHVRRVGELQNEIWTLARQAVAADGRPQTATLVLPSLNEMFDVGSARVVAATMHVPILITGLLLGMSWIASLLVGYGNPPSRRRNWLYRLVFIAMVAITVYVILDLEYPRVGVLRLDEADWPLIELRKSLGAAGMP